MMDALAEAIGMDPVDLRLRNIPAYSQAREGNPPYSSTGLRQCLEEGARAFGWKKAREETGQTAGKGPLRRGVGMASGSWFIGGGMPPATVIVKLFSDGSVNLNMGASDIGTGTKTVMAMVVSEELGVKTEMIQIEHADTGTTQYTNPSGGSKTVPTEAPAVRSAVVSIKRKLLSMAAQDLNQEASRLTFKNGEIVSIDNPAARIKVTDISSLKKTGVVVGTASREANPENRAIVPFAAQFCEVEVNIQTGEVKILRFLGAHDSGRVMSRLTYDNQVFGGITMGIGLAMMEERILDGKQTGKMVNRNWHDYKIPTAMDVPAEIRSFPIEIHDDVANTTGAKGLGEPVTIPTAAAVANAVYHATGMRITTTPMSPVQLCQRFAEGLKEG